MGVIISKVQLKPEPKVSVGHNHYLFLDGMGNVLAWGDNSSQQLGFKGPSMTEPKKIPLKNYIGNAEICDIATGWHHSLFLTKEGYVYFCGMAEFRGPFKYTTLYKKIEFPYDNKVKIVQISAAYFYSLLLDKEGKLYYFSSDMMRAKLLKNFVQKGERITKISAGAEYFLVLTNKGTVYFFDNTLTKKEGGKMKLKNVIDISVGTEDYLFLTEHQEVYICRLNFMRKLCSPPELVFKSKNVKISKISAGGNHSLVLCENNDLYSIVQHEYSQHRVDYTSKYKYEFCSYNETQVSKKGKICDISACDKFSMILYRISEKKYTYMKLKKLMPESSKNPKPHIFWENLKKAKDKGHFSDLDIISRED